MKVTVQVLAAGVTTFAGLVLDEDDQPVKGALVTLGATQVSTDDGGNFVMQNLPVGAEQSLLIDGGPASTPQHSLPVIPYKVAIVAGQANALRFVPHLHVQKTTGLVPTQKGSGLAIMQRLCYSPLSWPAPCGLSFPVPSIMSPVAAMRDRTSSPMTATARRS
ncbi:MAG: carboxypeptidase-like regulatory domain-containing protein [Nitrospira sp.]|nr:carboxypeptidase-like regulatory domain-containing protein [Nitrospira sp.]